MFFLFSRARLNITKIAYVGGFLVHRARLLDLGYVLLLFSGAHLNFIKIAYVGGFLVHTARFIDLGCVLKLLRT